MLDQLESHLALFLEGRSLHNVAVGLSKGAVLNQLRVSEAVEAAARALHDSVRDPQQFRWDAMTEQWRLEMRAYVRPCVLAALRASDEFAARPTDRRALGTRPRLEMVSR